MPRSKETTVRRWIEEMDAGNFDVLDELCTADYVCHFPGNPEPLSLEIHKISTRIFYAGFPDFHHTVEDVFACGDRAVLRATGHGTHRGSIMGIAPSERAVRFGVLFVFRFEGDRIAEAWGEADLFGMLDQLGALPLLGGEES